MKKVNQRDRVVAFMQKTGVALNPALARKELKIDRLAARICELEKKGYVFEKGWINGRNEYGAYRVRTYKLVKTPEENNIEI